MYSNEGFFLSANLKTVSLPVLNYTPGGQVCEVYESFSFVSVVCLWFIIDAIGS